MLGRMLKGAGFDILMVSRICLTSKSRWSFKVFVSLQLRPDDSSRAEVWGYWEGDKWVAYRSAWITRIQGERRTRLFGGVLKTMRSVTTLSLRRIVFGVTFTANKNSRLNGSHKERHKALHAIVWE